MTSAPSPREIHPPAPVALLPTSERFHWLTAPRSDVLQSSRVHSGWMEEPPKELERLFAGRGNEGGII